MTPDLSSLVQVNLRWGQPRTIGDIAEDMHVSRRAVEKAVEQLRLDGAPIITGSAGVWLTTSPDELRAAYRSLRRRYIHQAIGARVLLKTARRFEKHVQAQLWSDVA